LKFKATADLGALGAKAGPMIAWQWSPPSRLPRSLPVLALLLLLLPKRNRCRQALWVAAPVAATVALEFLVCSALGMADELPDGAFEILRAMTLGLAGAWLLLPYFSRRNRFVTFVGVLAAIELFSLFTCAVGQGQEGNSGSGDLLIGVAAVALLLSAALNLAGWSCRKKYGWWRLSLWLLLWIMAGWLVFFALMSVIEGPGTLPEMAAGLVMISAVSFALLLPFLVLSFANAFYRTRLQEVLRLSQPVPLAGPEPPAPNTLPSVAQ
jgi:peptidoglycan/LPS O-acetylase OafA/YrhL